MKLFSSKTERRELSARKESPKMEKKKKWNNLLKEESTNKK